MDGVGARFLRHPDDLGDRQIGGDRPQHLAVGQLADLIGLVRLEAVQGDLVLLGEHRDGAAAELVGGAEHADGDLRAVGDEDFLDRHERAPFKNAAGPLFSRIVQLRKGRVRMRRSRSV